VAKTWRQRFQPLIAKVIRDNAGKSLDEVRAALREAFPQRPHAHHPYKIWMDECRLQLGLKRAKLHPAQRQPRSVAGQQSLNLE
jgi:hypothetical protein